MDLGELDVALDAFLAAHPYYPCCLLISPDVVQLQRVSAALANRRGWPHIAIGTALSEALLNIAPPARAPRVAAILATAIAKLAPGPVICSESDLLFEPSLSLDPLLLLRRLSRNATLVVTWPGTYADGGLAYAVPEHAHYRRWAHPDLCLACVIAL